MRTAPDKSVAKNYHRNRNMPSRPNIHRTPRVVIREDNRITFTGRVNALAHRQFMVSMHDARRLGYQDLILDFSRCERAYSNGIIPILAHTDALRREHIDVEIIMPEAMDLDRLFRNANWAHFFEPGKFDQSDTVHERHLAARRFRDSDEQQRLVNDFMDVVMRNMTLERDVIAGLEWSINEITDNVLNHADCPEGGIVQVSTLKEAQKVAFAVADSGRGILASLREGHPDLRNDEQAINEAMKAGVTRNPDAGQGNGIAGTMRIAMMSEGSFEITSGLTQIVARSDKEGDPGSDAKSYNRREYQRFPGTVVYAELGLHKDFHLSDALGFSGMPHQPIDIIDLHYETDDGDAIFLRLRDEAPGFGSRRAGRQLRTKCLNLLNADAAKPMLLDWSGIPLVSSSFADEVFGRLFVELGPRAFMSRIILRNVAPTIDGLIDRAIVQRTRLSEQNQP